MTGNTKKEDRKKLWDTKRLFFCTPDAFKNDLATGTCPDQR